MIIKGYFCLFLHKIICCGYSLVSPQPQRGDSNEYPQHMILWRTDKIGFQLSSNILLICSSAALTSDCTILSSDSSPDNMPQCESSVWYIYWEKWLTSGRWKHLLITVKITKIWTPKKLLLSSVVLPSKAADRNGKQCKPWSDLSLGAVWTGSSLSRPVCPNT